MKTVKKTKTNASKFIDEARLDNDRRAKDTVEYEKMLFDYLEKSLKGQMNEES